MRYGNNISLKIDDNIVSNLHINLYKKNILESLESNLSINRKLVIIEKYNKFNSNYSEYLINLNSGNLYKDWDFII